MKKRVLWCVLATLAGSASSVWAGAAGEDGPASRLDSPRVNVVDGANNLGNNGDGVDVYEPWTLLDGMPPDAPGDQAFVRPAGGGQHILLDIEAIKNLLASAPLEGTPDGINSPVIIALPRPDGSFERFAVVESPIMQPGLAATFPDFRTYAGQSLDNPHSNLRCDVTEHGFRAQVLSTDGSFWIDPWTFGDTGLYTSYHKSQLGRDSHFACGVHGDEADHQDGIPGQGAFGDRSALERNGPTRREYVLAVAATVEFTAANGGTQSTGQAAIVTGVNRMNQVWENELAVRFILPNNNQNIVYVGSDPFTATDPAVALGQNQTTINSIIGSTNYDVGHLVHHGDTGGLAALGVVCGASKAQGFSGAIPSSGDAMWVDYVSHEIGHQFNAAHTFNSSVCAGNRSAASAMEPGSGTTIMAYAGICASDNTANNSSPYFHARSIDQILTFIQNTTCDTEVATGNTAPTVDAGPSGIAYTIPIGTPFALTATGSDINGDTLTYMWEQFLTGSWSAQGTPFADVGNNPFVRSLPASTNPTRTFPQIASLRVGATTTAADSLPLTTRTLVFRATARDNRSGGGGLNTDNISVATTTAAGPFNISSQNSNTVWGGGSTQTITWNVANTTAAPVSTANVRITFSTDNGVTFPIELVASTPNDGSQTITVPNQAVTQGRVRVEAIGNIFFDINNGLISIPAPPATPSNPQASPAAICPGGSSTLSVSAPGTPNVVEWYIGGCASGSVVGTGLSLNVSPASTTTYFARTRNTVTNGISTACAQVTVTVNTAPTAPTLAQIAPSGTDLVLSAAGGSGTTLRWFTDSCGGTLVGTGNNLVVPAPTQTTTYYARWETSCGNSACASATFTYTPPCPADFNGDTFVDDGDFVIFAEAYEAFVVPPANAAADLNSDGFVDDADFVIFASAYETFVCP